MQSHLEASPTSAPAAANALWEAYWQTHSQEARNDLMVHYLPLVKATAIRLASRRGPQAEIDDLVQHGIFGLKDAIGGFDPARGFKFETYCSMRLRGAMLDGLKARSGIPRDVRRRVSRFLDIHQQVKMEHGANPADETIAGRLGVRPEAIRGLQRDANRMSVLSLSETAGDSTDTRDARLMDTVADHREEDACDLVQRADVKELFLQELTRAQRTILILYYYEGMTMREIGDTLSISGTRVSQMHSDIIQRLRERLETRVAGAHGQCRSALEI